MSRQSSSNGTDPSAVAAADTIRRAFGNRPSTKRREKQPIVRFSNSQPGVIDKRSTEPAPEPGSALNLDRFLRARLGHLTFGLSPAGLLLVYLDWLAHVAISPGKHYDLARKMWRKTVRFAFYAARSGWRSGTPPAIEPLSQDERFNDPAWQRWPFNLYYQSFLFTQQWLYNATNGVRGVSPHHEQVMTFVGRQLLDFLARRTLSGRIQRFSRRLPNRRVGTLFVECRTSLRTESEHCWDPSQPE